MKVLARIIIGLSYQVSAQGGRTPVLGNSLVSKAPNRGKRLEEIKIEFMKQQLNFTAAESEKFWPLYAQYQDELKEVSALRWANSSSSNPDATKELSYEQKLLDMRKHYHEAFLKFLSVEKVNQVYKSEADFKYELIRHRNIKDWLGTH